MNSENHALPHPGSSKRYRHTYSTSQKTTLCLLRSIYDFHSASDMAKVFNRFYAKELSRLGLDKGLGVNAIAQQIWRIDHRMGSYADILSKDPRFLRRKHTTALKSIDRAIQQLEFEVAPQKLTSTVPIGPTRTTNRRSIYRCERISALLHSPSSTEVETEDEHFSQKAGRRCLRHRSSKFTPMRKPSGERTAASLQYWKKISAGEIAKLRQRKSTSTLGGPKILFRFWTRESGLKARLAMVEPPEDDELRTLVKAHLDRERVPTPFLSTTQNLIPAVHMAFRAGDMGSSFISIIDYDNLRESLRAKYGCEAIYLVPTLCPQYNIKGEDYYTGRGEFLIFQEIPRSSIISTFPISLLFEVEHRGIRLHDMLQLSTVITARNAKGLGDRLEPTSPAMCFKQGEIVGLFLEKAGVPINWKEIVGATVANHFRFAGFRNRRSRAYVDYMAGVFQISRNVRASTPVTIEQSGANEDSDTKGLGSEGEFESDTSEDDSDGDDDFVLVDFDEAEDVQGLLDNQLAMNMAEFADPAPSQNPKPTEQPLEPSNSFTLAPTFPITQRCTMSPFTGQIMQYARQPTPAPGPLSADRSSPDPELTILRELVDLTADKDFPQGPVPSENHQSCSTTTTNGVNDRGDDEEIWELVAREVSVLSIQSVGDVFIRLD